MDCRQNRAIKKIRTVGALITVVSVILLMIVFMGTGWFKNWRTNFFTVDSVDYIKDLYVTTWHVANDDSFTQCRGMNYPHGEYYTYSGLQPIIAFPLQCLRRFGVSNPENAVLPLMNILVMLSIVLCGLFLYLFLQKLGLPVWYSVLAALLITLLSPQLQRIGGHISLSYCCVIPMLLYFVISHLQTMHWGWDLSIGICALLAGLCHPYYIVFFVVVSLSEIVYLCFLRHKGKLGGRKILLSLILQLIVPLSLFYFFTNVGLDSEPRTSVPSGFYHYQSRIEGILFPYGRPYFYDDTNLFTSIKWESRCYVGILAVGAMLFIVCRFLCNLFHKQYSMLLRPTDNKVINLLLLSSVLLLLYAMGVPLNWFPSNIVSYIGPLAQIRATGRLAWLFFYVINVVAFYLLYCWWRNNCNFLRTFVVIMLILVASGEAIAYNWNNKTLYNKQWPAWTDYNNRTTENQWLDNFDSSSYQAILTLPVFNSGSEMATIWPSDGMLANSALLSLKTKLPLICNLSARSVIHQAWNCIALSKTAWTPFMLPKQFLNEKPLLLAVTQDLSHLNNAEMHILNHAQPVLRLNGMNLYSLPISAFDSIVEETQQELLELYDAAVLQPHPKYLWMPDTVQYNIHRWGALFDDTVDFCGDVEISCWMKPILVDQYSRCSVKITMTKSNGSTEEKSCEVDAHLDIVDPICDEGLFRIRLSMPCNVCHILIETRNRQMRLSKVSFFNLLIKPVDSHIATSNSYCQYIDNIRLTKPAK